MVLQRIGEGFPERTRAQKFILIGTGPGENFIIIYGGFISPKIHKGVGLMKVRDIFKFRSFQELEEEKAKLIAKHGDKKYRELFENILEHEKSLFFMDAHFTLRPRRGKGEAELFARFKEVMKD